MRIQLWRTVARSVLILWLAGPMLADDNKDSRDETSSNMMAMEERLARQEERIANLEGLLREQMALIVDARQALALLQAPTPASSTTDAETEVARGAPDATRAAAPEPQAAANAGWTSSHAYVNSANNDLTMQFSGRMHLDVRGYTDEETPDSTLVLRRARLTVEGNLFDNYSYKVETDFADRGSALLRDAYVNARFEDRFQLRFGQFKAPFSQERLQSSLRVNFVDRSSLSELSPGRSPGIMLHGSFSDDAVSYGLSVSNGLGILSTVVDSSPEVVGRLRFKPFSGSELFENFAFGGAYGRGRRDAGLSFRGRTASRSVTFFRPVPISGEMTRANAEFEWLLPKWAFRGEFDQAHQSRDGMGTDGGNLPGVVSKGYMFDAAYAFGGETQSNSAVVPYTTFLQNGGMGALQLVFRYENLQIDDSVSPNRGDAYTVGFNWWLSRFVRHQSNFAFEGFQHADRTGRFNGHRTFTYLGRMQLMF